MSARGLTINDTRTLVTETCVRCGVLFAMDREFQRDLIRARPRRDFYCPNGHSQQYTGKNEEELLREAQAKIAQQQRALANKDEDLRSERASHAGTKGQLTKARKKVERAERGVCVHCHRHFVNVERHVANKHPEKLETSNA